MSRLPLLVADFLIIAAGMAWAYLAGRHSLIAATHWPHGTTGGVLTAIPFAGMALEVLFIWLAAAGRLSATTWLAALSLVSALILMLLEISVVGYR